MVVSRTEAIVGSCLLVLATVGVWALKRAQLRFETVRDGAAQAVAVRSFKGTDDLPPGFRLTSWTTEGDRPTALFLRLPPSARTLPLATRWNDPRPGEVAARMILPDGSAERLEVQRMDGDGAMIQVVRNTPPQVPYVDLEVVVPHEKPSRWRLLNLPHAERGYPAAPLRTESGSGSGRVRGRAWWDEAMKREGGPGVFAALAAPGFTPGPGEACEIGVGLDLPYAQHPYDPKREPSMSTSIGTKDHHALGIGMGTPYASYLREVRLWGALRRLRVLEEWIDFGTVPLKPRRDSAGNSRGWVDVEPDLKATRIARTASGLELALQPFTNPDDNGYGGDPQTVSFSLKVVPSSRATGLPQTFGASPHVGVDREGRPGAMYTDVERRDPSGKLQNVSWPFFRPKLEKTVRLRMRVRRWITVEEIPFDLRLPLGGRPERTQMNRSDSGTSSFDVDPTTLRPSHS